MPLKCLAPKQALLICSSVGGGKCVAWVDQQEWKRLILCVVVPFFVHSSSLTSLCTSGGRADDAASGSGSSFHARTRQLLTNVTADNCFLEFPQLVKWKGPGGRRRGKKHWEAVKRRRELKTVCIKPAARSKINHGLVAQIVHGSPLPANRALFSGDGDLANRQVVWWENQGRIELRFDLRCTAIWRATQGEDSWTPVAVVRPGAGLEKCKKKQPHGATQTQIH